MTGFEQRFIREGVFFRSLIEKYNISRALDAGCGTGFHSLLLARLGVDATAVDVSMNMLAMLERHAREMNLTVRGVNSTFETLLNHVRGNYDAVFCMGNSLAHLLSKERLLLSLSSFSSVLKPGGILFIQVLNYDRILSQRMRIQSVKVERETTFVRYYAYAGEIIRFNVLKLKKDKGRTHRSMMSVELRPVLREELLLLLREAGFEDVKVFGGLSMEEFRSDSSRDLVVLAVKPK